MKLLNEFETMRVVNKYQPGVGIFPFVSIEDISDIHSRLLFVFNIFTGI